jgi:hypothetical protein
MPVPWLRVLNAALGITDFAINKAQARAARARASGDLGSERAFGKQFGAGSFDNKVAGVMVAALKEVFDRDQHRLELERERLDAERERAERAMRFELARQAGERDVARHRFTTMVALIGWLGTVVVGAWIVHSLAGRIALACGGLFLLAALGTSFAAQSRALTILGRVDPTGPTIEPVGGAALVAPWLILLGLIAATVAVVLS